MSSIAQLHLESSDWEAELLPDLGGAMAALRWRGVDVLRPMAEGATGPLDTSCIPLVPYCNRIRDGRFTWAGREVRMPRNFPPETSSLHGLGWQSQWQVASEGGFKCSLRHVHDGSGGWPWAYDAEQRVRLGPKGCAVTLDLTNRSDRLMPTGLGLHPYLRRRPETKVQFLSAGTVMVDEALIPTGELAPPDHFADWRGRAALPSRLVDHSFTGWDGAATVEDDLGTITLTARGAPCLHVYAPPDGSALCLEPVSHTPDAPNRNPAGMIALPPGCTASLTMWIAAS